MSIFWCYFLPTEGESLLGGVELPLPSENVHQWSEEMSKRPALILLPLDEILDRGTADQSKIDGSAGASIMVFSIIYGLLVVVPLAILILIGLGMLNFPDNQHTADLLIKLFMVVGGTTGVGSVLRGLAKVVAASRTRGSKSNG